MARRAAGVLTTCVSEGVPLRLRLEGEQGDDALDLPPAAVAVLREALEAMAAGKSVAVLARPAEMTIVEAAEALGVSRPFLIRLLEEGRIPHRKVGRHRRVRAEDVLAHKAAIDAAREAVLDRLAAEAQAEGMGYDPAWARPPGCFSAGVLYPAPLRDLLMQLAVDDVFAACWTADIHAEWIGALPRREPHRERARLVRTAALMDEATRDALVTGHDDLIPCLTLPDPDDRHVLAAAIAGRCPVVVTADLGHSPAAALAPYGLEAVHPDAFLFRHLERDPDTVVRSVRRVRARLQAPPLTVEQHLAVLARQGLAAFVGGLRRHSGSL